MKVMMDRDGTIEIRPESQTENYALTKWLEEYADGKTHIRLSRWISEHEFSKDHIVEGRIESHVEVNRPPNPLANAYRGGES